MKSHSYTSLIIRGRVMPIMVQSGGGGGGSAFGVVLLARRAKREGDGGFIHSLLMMMMRFQEGTATMTGGYVGERVSLHGLICEIWLMGVF